MDAVGFSGLPLTTGGCENYGVQDLQPCLKVWMGVPMTAAV